MSGSADPKRPLARNDTPSDSVCEYHQNPTARWDCQFGQRSRCIYAPGRAATWGPRPQAPSGPQPAPGTPSTAITALQRIARRAATWGPRPQAPPGPQPARPARNIPYRAAPIPARQPAPASIRAPRARRDGRATNRPPRARAAAPPRITRPPPGNARAKDVGWPAYRRAGDWRGRTRPHAHAVGGRAPLAARALKRVNDGARTQSATWRGGAATPVRGWRAIAAGAAGDRNVGRAAAARRSAARGGTWSAGRAGDAAGARRRAGRSTTALLALLALLQRTE